MTGSGSWSSKDGERRADERNSPGAASKWVLEMMKLSRAEYVPIIPIRVVVRIGSFFRLIAGHSLVAGRPGAITMAIGKEGLP